jgi:nitronate monooxygenase
VPSLKLSPLSIGNKTASVPIIQGGMGVGVSLAGLASAVANEGGIGVIAAAGIGMRENDFYSNYLQSNTRALRSEIRKSRLMTDGILGLNIMVAVSNYSELVQVAIEEGIDVIFSGAGLPLTLPGFLKSNSKTALVPIVSSARAAGLLCRMWLRKYDYLPDAFVVEGPKAGGHLGFKEEQILDPAYALEKLIPAVLEETAIYENRYGKKIPVIAAGGIYTGRDMWAFMDIGVGGVQMGTRFVATHECDADISFKKMYIDARIEDVVIIKSPVGMPGRAIRNQYIDDVASGLKKPFKCPYHCIITCDYKNTSYCIASALISAQKGLFNNGFAFAGANVFRVNKIISVKELITSLVMEYYQAAANNNLKSLIPNIL